MYWKTSSCCLSDGGGGGDDGALMIWVLCSDGEGEVKRIYSYREEEQEILLSPLQEVKPAA